MPTITDETVTGHAHCPNPRCDQYEYETPVVKRTVSWTYAENGGDLPGIERSTIEVVATKDTEDKCPRCGRYRELSIGERPEYPNESGVDPNGLLGFQPQVADPQLIAAQQNAELAAQLADLQAQLAELKKPAAKAPAKGAA